MIKSYEISMNEHELKPLTNKPVNINNIAGIFNYCDRWCKHCKFIAKCTFFQMGNAIIDQNQDDVTLWENLKHLYEELESQIEEKALKSGFSIINEKAWSVTGDYNRQKAIKIARKYHLLVTRWLDAQDSLISKKQLLFTNSQSSKATQQNIAINIIRWYNLFIPLKTASALHEYEDEILNNSPFIRGSAKIALISIDRSIQSMVILNDLVPEKETDLLYFMKLLVELRSRILIKVPDAMEYIRPGLDEE